ncbi:MAG: metallophosphoesterase [Rhizobium sp.]|nr:metallophosphoesterase [Rhizobium sp.]MCZ8349746.1 metallophosphoesterase [Rhizobium sp.]
MTTEIPRLRLGIIADPQYADLDPDPQLNRYFRRSLDKLREAVEHFNADALDAVIVLGDLIDRGWENFAPVLDILARLKAPRILLPGNHDFLVAADRLASVHALLDMPSPYHEVRFPGIRLLVLDTCEISLFAAPEKDARHMEAQMRLAALKARGGPNAHDWNAGIADRQAIWIADRLAAAEAEGDRVILLGHYPIHPPSDHLLWDGEELARLIASSSSAIAYLCGHHHAGGYGEENGVHFVNFCGMVDTEETNAFAVLSVFEDRMEVVGQGREPHRRLRIAPSTERSRRLC